MITWGMRVTESGGGRDRVPGASGHPLPCLKARDGLGKGPTFRPCWWLPRGSFPSEPSATLPPQHLLAAEIVSLGYSAERLFLGGVEVAERTRAPGSCPLKLFLLGVRLAGVSTGRAGGSPGGIHPLASCPIPAELGLVSGLLAEHWQPGAAVVGVVEGVPPREAALASGAVATRQGGRLVEDGIGRGRFHRMGPASAGGCGATWLSRSFTSPVPPAPFRTTLHSWLIPLGPGPACGPGRSIFPGRGCFTLGSSQQCPVWQRDAPTGKEKSPKSAGGCGLGGNNTALMVVAVAASLPGGHSPTHREARKGREDTAVAPGAAASPRGAWEEQSCWDEGSRASWDGRRWPGDPTKQHEPAPGLCPAAPGAAR